MPGNAGQIRAGRAYVEAGLDDSPLVAGLNRAGKKLKAWGDTVTAAGYDLLKGGLAAGLPIGFSAKEFADFETGLARVSTLLEDPAAHMEAFRKGIQGLSTEFGQSTGTLSKGLYDLLSAGVAPAKVMDVLRTSVTAAAAGVTETSEAVTALVSVLNAYNLPAERAADVADLLFKTETKGRTTFAELAQTIGTVTSSASSAGLTLEELGAALATMTSKGLQTDMAVTALNNILTEFTKPSVESAAAAAKFGIQLNTATLKSMGLIGVLRKLKSAGASTEDVTAIFGNIRSARGALPLINDLDLFAERIEDMKHRAGSTEEAYSKLAGTLSIAFERAHQAVMTVAVAVGEAMKTPLVAAGRAVESVSSAVADFVSRNRALAVATAAVAAASIVAGGSLVALGLGLHFAGVAAGALATVLAAIGAAGSGVLSVVFSPVTIGAVAAAAALAGLGYVFVTTTDAGGRAAQGLRDAWGKVSAYVGGVLSTLRDDFGKTYQGINDAMASGQLGVAARLLWNGVQIEWTRGIAGLQGLWSDFTAKLTDPTASALAWLGTSWEAIGMIAAGAFRSAVDGAVLAFSTIQALTENWRDSAKLVAVSVGLAFVKAWEWTKFYFLEILPTSMGWFANNAITVAAGLLSKLAAMVVSFVSDAVQLVENVVPQVVAGIVAAVANGGSFADSVAQQIATTIAGAFARGYSQDVTKTGGPQFQQRQKSDLETSLEKEQAALSGALGDAIKKRFAENKAAVDAALAGIAAGGDGPSARDRLAELLKQRDDLLREATGKAGNGGAIGDAIDALSKLAGVDLRKGIASRGAKVSEDATAGVAAAAAKTSTAGTFSAVAAALLTRGPSADYQARTAKATEKLPGLLKDVVRAIENVTGATFG